MFSEYPENQPTLWTDRKRYEPGDVLRANCSSPPARPQVELTLTLNNIVVSTLNPTITSFSSRGVSRQRSRVLHSPTHPPNLQNNDPFLHI